MRTFLCGSNSEDIPHLFLSCPTSLRTFSYFADKFGVVFPIHDSVSSLLSQWLNSPFSKAAFRYLPFLIFWSIWNLRNKCIFENWKPTLPALIIRIEGLLNTYPAPTKSLKIRKVGSKPVLTFPCGFLDGASAANLCGSGCVIYLNEQHYLCFSIGCGIGTNTRDELLASWAVLRISQMMGIPIQLIFGDSLVIISWLNCLSALDVPALVQRYKKIACSGPSGDCQAHCLGAQLPGRWTLKEGLELGFGSWFFY